MSTQKRTEEQQYRNGFDDGYAAARADLGTNTPGVHQQFYDLSTHDIDTLAMGIALIVLHAADLATISATMDTQQKLGIAEKVLGQLHLISIGTGTPPEDISLREESPNLWLNTDAFRAWGTPPTEQFEKPGPENGDFERAAEADDDKPF